MSAKSNGKKKYIYIEREIPRLSDILHKTGADSQRWILILAVD